jgi:hypothetical protein
MPDRRIVILIIIGLLIGIAVYFSYSPEESSVFPQCPFHYLTGYDCPGCGSQRAFHHLLHFRVTKAFSANPLMVLAIPYLLIGFYFEYFGGKQSYPEARKILFGRNATIIVFVVIILFWIGRNVLT